MKDSSFKASGVKRKKAGAKRTPSPFFVFLAEFRPQFLEKHPELKAVKEVTKAAGEKWRSMSDEEKAKYGGGASKKPDAKESKKESTSSKKAKTDGGEEAAKSEVEDDDEQDANEGEDE